MAQTIIALLPIPKLLTLLREKYASLPENGTFFAICSSEYDAMGNVVYDFLDVIANASALGYGYVNTIVYPAKTGRRAAFIDNVRYVVWLCKDRAHMTLNKDAIREKHIWKDVEWGKRAKNYDPKGKDPGNVWIPTEDDGHAHITKHLLLSDADVIRRLRALADCKEDCEVIAHEEAAPQISLRARTGDEKEAACASCRGQVFFHTSEHMEEIEDGSASVAVTSPPYWDLKDYFKEGQIGQESYGEYLRRIRTVWRECYRKLSPQGSLWININIRVRDGKVISIPHDFVKICKELGFYYKGIFIWHKSSGIPTSEKNIVDRHEYVLLFSKDEAFCIDPALQASFGDYKNTDINGGAFWNINKKAGSVGKKTIHPAVYPNELVARIVKLASRPGDLVIDPFLGSGTTLIAALRSGRSCVGYEYNERFSALMRARFDRELPEGAWVDLT